MSKMKPMTAQNRASTIVIGALGLLVFCLYACSAKADSMLGKMNEPSFMGVTANPPVTPERWVIDVIAVINGEVAAAATYGDAEFSSEPRCEEAVKTDAQLNASAARALDVLGKNNPGAKIAIVVACAMKVN